MIQIVNRLPRLWDYAKIAVGLPVQYWSSTAITWGSTISRSSKSLKCILQEWGESLLNISLEEILTANTEDLTTIISDEMDRVFEY